MRNAIAIHMLDTFAAAAVIVLAIGCNHDRGGSTTTTGASIITTDDAVSHLTAARCEREMDCNNIGTGKHYEDRGACEREVSHDLQSDLRPEKCTYGIREDRMGECLQELKNEKCGNPLDAMSRLATCRTSRLCLR
jgi:hypothetical protein